MFGNARRERGVHVNAKLPSIFYTGKLLPDSDDLIFHSKYLSQGPTGCQCCAWLLVSHILSGVIRGSPILQTIPVPFFQGRATSGKLENTTSRVLHGLLLVCVGLAPGLSPGLLD